MPITTSQPRVASPPVEQTTESTAPPEFQPLNAMDCSMHAVNDALRGTGAAGFETQCLVWLEERADLPRLRTAISRLSRVCPVMTARLKNRTRRQGAGWRFRPGQECPLHETTLDSADDSAALDAAARLLSTPRDLATEDPISFHLLHRPDDRDLFLMQYNHTLMDHIAASDLLRRINELAFAEPDANPRPLPDPLGDYLNRKSRSGRLQAALRTARLRLWSLRGASARLGRDRGDGDPAQVQIITRELDADLTAAFRARIVQTCRFPALSMGLLASAFRALRDRLPESESDKQFIAGIGLDLGLRRPAGPLLQNLVSLIPLSARPEQMYDHEQFVRSLNSQMRDRLQRQIDYGVIALSELFRRFPRFVRWSTSRLMQRGYSFWYACFPETKFEDERFCGAEIEKLTTIGPAWPPLGLTLIINQFRGRLLLQVTHLPDFVPGPLAEAFLDSLLNDIRTFAEDHRTSEDASGTT